MNTNSTPYINRTTLAIFSSRIAKQVITVIPNPTLPILMAVIRPRTKINRYMTNVFIGYHFSKITMIKSKLAQSDKIVSIIST